MPVGVAGGGIDLDGDEGLAELAAQRLEAFLEAEGVVAEAQAEDAGPAVVRSLTRARSASEIPMSALNFLESGKGSEGWLSTGARTTSSTIMASANPPVKHIPTTPTPGRRSARARRRPACAARP